MPKGELSKEQVKDWSAYRYSKTNTLSNAQYKMICEIHADVFAHPYHEPCTCSSKRIKEYIAQIDKVYEARNSN